MTNPPVTQQNQQNKNHPDADENQLDQRVLNIDRVARVVKGGRRFRFRALVAIGDGKGSVGVGSAKGADVTSAITKAADVAKRKMRLIQTSKSTIPHAVEGKEGGAKVLVMPASEGTGLIAGSVPREIMGAAGIKNIVTKSLGNNNKTNVAYAIMDALDKLVAKKDWITTKNNKTRKA